MQNFPKWAYSASFILIALAIGYSFLFIPLHNKYCERYVNRIKKESSKALAEASVIFNERKGGGIYEKELCPENHDNRYKDIFNDIESVNYDSSALKADCKTEYRIIHEIAEGLYPKMDERNQEEIIKECKNRL